MSAFQMLLPDPGRTSGSPWVLSPDGPGGREKDARSDSRGAYPQATYVERKQAFVTIITAPNVPPLSPFHVGQ